MKRNLLKAAVSFGVIVHPVQYLRSAFRYNNTETFSLKNFGEHYDLLKVIFFLIPRIPNPLMAALLHGVSLFGNAIYQKKGYRDDSKNPLLNEKECGFLPQASSLKTKETGKR